MKITPKKPAFTLTELLIAIAIIAVIVSLAVVAYNSSMVQGRDHQRVSDITQIQIALEQYHRDEGFYPDVLTPGEPLIGSTSSTTYMSLVPLAPSVPDGDCSSATNNFNYTISADGETYGLRYCLGGKVNQVAAGVNCADQSKISGGDCFVCGDTIAYEGGLYDIAGTSTSTDGYYRTVQIGSQCWLKDNLNVGARIDGGDNATDNSITEKYCYDNDDSNCAIYGGLYQWTEAMQYSTTTESIRGICPENWHIPSDAEQNSLDQYLWDPSISPNTCDPARDNAWDCSDAGTKMQVGGSSGFDGLMGGYRFTGIFTTKGTWGYFWSSSVDGSQAWFRYLNNGGAPVGRNNNWQTAGYSVRCVQD